MLAILRDMPTHWRDPIKRTAIIATAVFVVIVVCYVAVLAQQGMWVNGYFLKRVSQDQYGTQDDCRIDVAREDDVAEFRYKFGGSEGTARMTVTLMPQMEWQDDEGNVITYNDASEVVEITYDDGKTWRGEAWGNRLWGENGYPQFPYPVDDEGEIIYEETFDIDGLYNIYNDNAQSRGPWWMAFPATILFALGVAVWIRPQEMAFLGSRWMFATEPELSDAGVSRQRLGAVVLAIAALGLMAFGKF